MLEIEFRQNKNGLHIGVRVNYKEEPFWFTLNEETNASKWLKLIYYRLWEELERHVENDRATMYNLGWEDAKKKRKKKVNFNVCFNSKEDLAWED